MKALLGNLLHGKNKEDVLAALIKQPKAGAPAPPPAGAGLERTPEYCRVESAERRAWVEHAKRRAHVCERSVEQSRAEMPV